MGKNPMKMKFIDKKTQYKLLEKSVKDIKNKELAAGYFSDSESNGTPIAGIAAWNDLGCGTGGKFNGAGRGNSVDIPARPFVRNSIDNNVNYINKIFKTGYGKVLDLKLSGARFIKIIGEVFVNMIKKELLNMSSPPNAPSTINAKKSSKPLIDKGGLLMNIKYKIRKKGESK